MILATAGQLFDARDGQLSQLTMAILAREAGLAKGTLYLYFRSKEEIFLALFLEELGAWLTALQQGLDRATRPLSAERAADVVVTSLTPRTRLLNLLRLLHPVLETRLSAQDILSFKEALAALLLDSADHIERAMPALGPGQGLVFLCRLHALVVGLNLATRPPPAVAEAIASRPHLATLRPDFATELGEVVTAMLRGWQRPS